MTVYELPLYLHVFLVYCFVSLSKNLETWYSGNNIFNTLNHLYFSMINLKCRGKLISLYILYFSFESWSYNKFTLLTKLEDFIKREAVYLSAISKMAMSNWLSTRNKNPYHMMCFFLATYCTQHSYTHAHIHVNGYIYLCLHLYMYIRLDDSVIISFYFKVSKYLQSQI